MTKLPTIKPESYGLEEEKAKELKGNLPQIITERDILERLLIQKNRTQGLNVWHKTTKDYFLKGGQFIDAIKRKEIAVNERMENDLLQVEKHFEYKEAKRLEELQESRCAMFVQYDFDGSGVDLASMDQQSFDNLLLGAKTQFENKQREEKEAEEARLREIALQKTLEERKALLYKYAPFHTEVTITLEMTEDKFVSAIESVKKKKEAYEIEQAEIRAENERLKKEAEEKAAKIKAENEERERLEKIEAEKRKKAEEERIAAQKIIDDTLRAEKEKAEKAAAAAQKIIDDRLAAEQKLIQEEEERKRALLIAGDKAILSDWVNSIMIPKTMHVDLDPSSQSIVTEIIQKFNGFKSWAVAQINNID